MLCPSCRLAISLPQIDTASQSSGDTQPLLPAAQRGDTEVIPSSKPSDPEAPAVELRPSDIVRRDTPDVPIRSPAITQSDTRPIDAEPAEKPRKPTQKDIGVPSVQKGDTRPVSVGPPSQTDTRPVDAEPSAGPGPDVSGDEEVVELGDERARWMDRMLDEFVEKHHGEWKTGDLILLSERLSRVGYRYLDIVALNAQLQKKKDAYNATTARNIKKLLEGNKLKDFVDVQMGRWSDKELAAFLKQAKAEGLWPVKLPALNKALEDLRRPWKVKMAANLKRLVKDGVLREYIESRRGGWTQDGWKDLIKQLDGKGYAPFDPTSVAMALRKELTLRARENLIRLQKKGILTDFVAAHKGDWTREDLQKLLVRIEKDGYAPIVNLGAALDAERERWSEGNARAT
ncbi:MAG: hypothetical protein GXP25_00945 [Planctomycetes bacterium]|nr:hypothetical protein [Planctomycetota bacterium]